MNSEITPITTHDVESRIIMVRGQKVILDCHVAELYGVETKRINEAVRNNPEKFPPRCIIQLDKNDLRLISSKSSEYFVDENFDRKSVSNKSRYLPKAFTERGLYMLATILKSPRATRTTLAIIDTFVEIREMARTIETLQNVSDGGEQQQTLLKKTGHILGNVIGTNLSTASTETEIELNFAVVKIRHKVTSK